MNCMTINTEVATPLRRPTMRARACTECGSTFLAEARTPHAEFCGAPCRKAFNNRRMVRGAELYDLVMALRYDRKLATAFKVWKLICRMAATFHEEDATQRAGRKSWRSPRVVVERHPYLRATVVATNIAGNRRRD